MFFFVGGHSLPSIGEFKQASARGFVLGGLHLQSDLFSPATILAR